MSHATIKVSRYLDQLFEVLTSIFQFDNGKNQWHRVDVNSQTWDEWAKEWLYYLDNDVAAFGKHLYVILKRINIVPLHTVPKAPCVDSEKVDWKQVGLLIMSWFRI